MSETEKPFPKLEEGMTIHVSPVGNESLDPSLGKIEKVEGEIVSVRLDLSFAMLGRNDLLLLQLDKEERVGWARVIKADVSEDVLVLVAGIRWEEGPRQRSARYPASFRIVLTYSEPGQNGAEKEVKRSLGQTINISDSGVRFHVRTPLKMHTIVKMEVFIDEANPFVALGRVVRIVEGAEGKTGGFEVGVEFLRKLGGEESLSELLKSLEPVKEAA